MPSTPDRFPGTREEDEIELVEDSTDPTVEGRFRYVSGSFRMKDAIGVFDPRSGAGDFVIEHLISVDLTVFSGTTRLHHKTHIADGVAVHVQDSGVFKIL